MDNNGWWYILLYITYILTILAHVNPIINHPTLQHKYTKCVGLKLVLFFVSFSYVVIAIFPPYDVSIPSVPSWNGSQSLAYNRRYRRICSICWRSRPDGRIRKTWRRISCRRRVPMPIPSCCAFVPHSACNIVDHSIHLLAVVALVDVVVVCWRSSSRWCGRRRTSWMK